MWIFLIACLLLTLFWNVSVISFVRHNLAFLQHTCLTANPLEHDFGILWQALVCGRSLNSLETWSETLKASGLIHIFVVSGSHFLVLQFLFQIFRIPWSFTTVLLWIFNGLTGFSAPGTRACLQVTGKDFFKMRSDQNILATSLMCLALNPHWAQSHSFWLSWLACLILTISPRDPLKIGTQFIFFLLWNLIGFSLSAWSILLNILLAPLIGWLLFPLALVATFPLFENFFVWSIQALEIVLRLFQFESAPNPKLRAIPQVCFLVFSIHLVLQLYHLARQGRHLK